jgi:hypothetical protein
MGITARTTAATVTSGQQQPQSQQGTTAASVTAGTTAAAVTAGTTAASSHSKAAVKHHSLFFSKEEATLLGFYWSNV